MSYRENAKPRDPMVREPVRWHRWALAASPLLVLAATVARDLGAWAALPSTGNAVEAFLGAFVFASIIAFLNEGPGR